MSGVGWEPERLSLGVAHIQIVTTAVDMTIVGPMLLISVRLYF